ncbi:hypothetical protein CMK11_20595 [Candidatus Poribacteria bacterium]|nr:hypothetical protein [Candidatus Poribacteria bacterium]
MKLRTARAVCAVLAMFGVASSVHGLNWEQLPGPYTGEALGIFAAPSGSLFVGLEVGAVYRSDDGGDSWSHKSVGIESPFPTAFAASGTYVFAVTYYGHVYRTDDNGESWVRKDTGVTWGGADLGANMASHAGGVFLGTSAGGVFRTDDDGETWTQKNGGLPASAKVTRYAAIGSTLFAAVWNAGIYKTEDAGESWTLTPGSTTHPNDLVAAGSSLYVAHDSSVSRSGDGGATWSVVYTGSNTCTRLLATAGSVFVYVNTDGVYRTDNDGATWALKAAGLFSEATIYRFATDGTAAYIASMGGVFRTLDNGESWQGSQTGIVSAHVNGIYFSASDMYAATNQGVFHSGDGGFTWNARSAGLAYSVTETLVQADGYLLVGTSRGVYRSSDGGVSWVVSLDASPQHYDLTVHGSSVYIARNEGSPQNVARTSDGGATWEYVGTGLPSSGAGALLSTGSTLFVGLQQGVYRSEDNAASWTATSLTTGNVLDLAQSDGTLFAATETGLYRSADGDVWEESLAGSTYRVAEFADSVYVGIAGAGVFRSDDAGVTWVADNLGLEDYLALGKSFFRSMESDGTYLYAGTYAGGIFRSAAAPPVTVSITAPAADQVFPPGTTAATLTVDLENHASPGHWHWQLDSPFAASGVVAGNEVAAGTTSATIPGLTDGASHTVYVTLVEDQHSVLATPVEAPPPSR